MLAVLHRFRFQGGAAEWECLVEKPTPRSKGGGATDIACAAGGLFLRVADYIMKAIHPLGSVRIIEQSIFRSPDGGR